MLAIKARDVYKRYEKNGVEALKGVDLDVRQGEIFGLLGPNGAGKTTLVRILATQLRPTRGTVEILGLDLARDTEAIRKGLSTVPQAAAPDAALKVWEQIYYYLVARGMEWREARRATMRVTEELGLDDRYEERIGFLSGGMRRRVVLAMALACPSRLVYMDEPTAGLDVMIRRETWEILGQIKHRKTILVTTHSMEEAEALSDRLAILNEGRVAAVGTPAELRGMAPARQKVVMAESAVPRHEVEALGPLQHFAGNWVVYTRSDEATEQALALAVKHRVEASVLNITLEDAFVHLVGNGGGNLVEKLT